MSTPPLVEMPTSAGIADITVSLATVVSRTQSPYSLQNQAFRWPGEQWRMDLSIPPIADPQIAGEWKAFGVQLEGSYGYFLCGDPSGRNPVGVGTGTPLLKGAGQLGNSILIDGLTPSTTNILRAGDYVQIGTGTNARLHMQMVDLDSDSSGEATLTLRPAVRRAQADNEAVSFHNAVGLFRMAENTFEWRVTPGPIYIISPFSAEEVI